MNGIKNKVIIPYEEAHRDNNGKIEKICNKCSAWFPCNEEYFYKNDKSPDGLFPSCKKCICKKSSEWEKENSEHVYNRNKRNREADLPYIRESNRKAMKKRRDNGIQLEWQRDNAEKCREYNQQHRTHKINLKEWKECKEYFNNECAYCGLPIEEHWVNIKGEMKLGDFHKEHVIHNGENDLSNCVPACKECNCQKWQNLLENWYPKQEFYSEDKYKKVISWIANDYKNFID